MGRREVGVLEAHQERLGVHQVDERPHGIGHHVPMGVAEDGSRDELGDSHGRLPVGQRHRVQRILEVHAVTGLDGAGNIVEAVARRGGGILAERHQGAQRRVAVVDGVQGDVNGHDLGGAGHRGRDRVAGFPVQEGLRVGVVDGRPLGGDARSGGGSGWVDRGQGHCSDEAAHKESPSHAAGPVGGDRCLRGHGFPLSS